MGRTHYDNLKVMRTAPPEVIRAAYRALAARYHPDKCENKAEATRIMTIVNAAYEVLQDPKRRQEYDEALAFLEYEEIEEAKRPRSSSTESAPPAESTVEVMSTAPEGSSRLRRSSLPRSLLIVLLVIVAPIAILFLVFREVESTRSRPVDSRTSSSLSAAPDPAPIYSRPELDPLGDSWPVVSAYLVSAPRLRRNGLSSVSIDNTRCDAGVHVKLVYLGQAGREVVRQCFIPAFSQFVMKNVSAGRYDIRYRDLTSGTLARSEPFELLQNEKDNGIEYSEFSLTLYTVRGGNTSTYPIDEAEF